MSKVKLEHELLESKVVNKHEASVHLVSSESYFLVTQNGSTVYSDIELDNVDIDFVEELQDQVNNILDKVKMAQSNGDLVKGAK